MVIGGGINGAASANRLAGAGYEVLLIDAGDFGSGSSSRSSRIMHCGLNYLAAAADATSIRSKTSNVVLAGQMMRERRRLRSVMGRRISPHTFYIPLLAGDPVASWKYDLAFAVLNALSGWDSTLDYRRYRQNELGHIGITRYFGGGLTGLAAFTEYVFDWPERICVDHAMDAAAYGAAIRNYTELVAAHSGSDLVNAACGLSDGRTVTPNKGCHIAVRLPEEFRRQRDQPQRARSPFPLCAVEELPHTRADGDAAQRLRARPRGRRGRCGIYSRSGERDAATSRSHEERRDVRLGRVAAGDLRSGQSARIMAAHDLRLFDLQ